MRSYFAEDICRVLIILALCSSVIGIIENIESNTFSYEQKGSIVGSTETVNTTGFNATYKEAFLLWSLLRKLHLDFVSPLYREEVFISLKDTYPSDTIEINDGIKTIYQIDSNYSSKYAIPNETLSKNSTSSVVKGIPVYVDYGRQEDFDLKKFNKNDQMTDYIALIRLGKISIEEKVDTAFRLGVSGVLLYADPQDFTELNTSKVHHEILPVVLGKLQQKYGNSMNKVDEINSECVPVQIIPADVADKILSEMPTAPSIIGSKDKMINVSYPNNSGFAHVGWNLVIKTRCTNIRYENYDIVASIAGTEERDRYVIVGSNRQPMKNAQINLDKTAVLIEMMKTLSAFKYNGGGVPRRSIVFFSWGLEGLEYYARPRWLEPHMRLITERAVGYIHINNPVQGMQRLKVETTLPLHELIIDVASGIQNPNIDEVSMGKLKVVDTWNDSYENGTEPRFHMIQDYWLFTFKVPAVSMYYVDEDGLQNNKNEVSNDESNENITLSYKETVMYMLISIVHRLADNDLLPYKLTAYPYVLNRSINALCALYKDEIAQLNVSSEFDKFRGELVNFDEHVNKFENKDDYRRLDDWRELDIRIRNDQVMNFNKILFCTRERYDRPLLLSENINGLTLSPVQDYLLSAGDKSTAKSSVYKSLRNATLCLIDAIDVLSFDLF